MHEDIAIHAACQVDVVIDTNVFVHSQNPGDSHHESCVTILAWIRDAEVSLILDDQGKRKPNPETSLLYSEYMTHFTPQGLPRAVLAHLMINGRVHFVDRPGQHLRNAIRKICPSNVCDRAVLGAAAMSASKHLVSNDWADFGERARRSASKDLNVEILDSIEAVSIEANSEAS